MNLSNIWFTLRLWLLEHRPLCIALVGFTVLAAFMLVGGWVRESKPLTGEVHALAYSNTNTGNQPQLVVRIPGGSLVTVEIASQQRVAVGSWVCVSENKNNLGLSYFKFLRAGPCT